jgi:hypothetical protein
MVWLKDIKVLGCWKKREGSFPLRERDRFIFVSFGKNCSVKILTALLDSIAMEPRALGVSSTLAFVEHERGRGFF